MKGSSGSSDMSSHSSSMSGIIVGCSLCVSRRRRHDYSSGSLSVDRGAGGYCSEKSSRSSLPLVGRLPVL